MQSLRLVEPYRNLFYSMLYVARALDLFQPEGLSVEVRTRTLDEDVLNTLRRDEADLVLTGPMRLLVDADSRQAPLARNFLEVNSRDGFMLLGRKPTDQFTWTQVEGRTILVFRDPPTPWMCLLSVLAEQGLASGQVELPQFPSLPAALAAFEDGQGDFIELPEPLAAELIESGRAHLATPMASQAGPLAFTSFAALPERLEQERLAFLSFTRAIYAAQKWMLASTPRQIAELAADFLPDDPIECLVAGAARYKEEGTWPADPLLRPEGFDRLQTALKQGGLIKGSYQYREQVDTEFARAVMSEPRARPDEHGRVDFVPGGS